MSIKRNEKNAGEFQSVLKKSKSTPNFETLDKNSR